MERRNGLTNALVEKLKNVVDDNLTNEQFGVEELSKNIGISRSQLHRKLHATTGQSVSQFIREYRRSHGSNPHRALAGGRTPCYLTNLGGAVSEQ
jgi:AraC-like DNA-binding protein